MDNKPSVMNIALVGGKSYCKEILEKTSLDQKEGEITEGIVAVADPDPQSPGMLLAGQLGLITVNDYHELYDPRYDIHLIIVLIPEQNILEDILKTRPPNIRILSYKVFELFWKAIGLEERKLRERTKEMETILNGIQDFILVITPDRTIVEVNDAFLTKMGYSREQVIGRKCHDVYQKTYDQCNEEDPVCPLREVVRTKSQWRQVRTGVGSDGDPRYFEINVYPIWEKDSKISKFIHISRDVTERRKEEEEITRRLEHMVEERTRELKETHDKLLHQDKMASLGKLSASVVHEINNPIAGILNLTLLIKRILEEGPTRQKEIDQFNQYLDLMELETRRTGRIVSNLLAFSRQSKMEPKRLNLNRLIEQTLFLNSNLLKINGVKVEKSLEPDLPYLVGSGDQLQQVLMNIISNAVEAMETNGGGVLSIETKHLSTEGKILASFRDTGKGIPDENLSRLFEPFFTTKKKGKGVGLGLSVAYGIIQEHGGSIHAKSEVEQGSTFIIELPLKQPSGSYD
ncbi:MAG: PAS domain-containing protein [Desulfobacteraceae bacterium]|nr:PAS domain-containing protein [Desulfobacteraceae bacterium]